MVRIATTNKINKQQARPIPKTSLHKSVPLLSQPLQIVAHSSEDKRQNKRWFPVLGQGQVSPFHTANPTRVARDNSGLWE